MESETAPDTGLRDLGQSPGPLRISDLRPRKLEPLSQPSQARAGSGEAGSTGKKKKKKTRRRKREDEEEEKRTEDLDGREAVLEERDDPLLSTSALQQMQARLDPLYSARTPPVNASSEEKEDEEEGGEEGVVGTQKRLRKRKRRRVRRESGSGMSETALQEVPLPDEQERVTSLTPQPHSPPRTAPEARRATTSSLPHYPPPEEIQDERQLEEGTERVVEGASPPDVVSRHIGQSPDLVFVERADGRGFDARHKSSSVAPADYTKTLHPLKRPISSEVAALYSHQIMQIASLTAYGILAGLSLWDCVVRNVIGSLSGRHLTLLRSFHLLSLPAHSLYLLLLSLVSLSMLDRLDVARLSRQRWQFTVESLPGLAVLTATLLTGVAFIVSLSIAATDDRVSLYPDQPALWPDIVTPHNLTVTNSTSPILTTHTASHDLVYLPTSDNPTTARLNLWLGLSTFRSICCVLGWGLLVLASQYDRLEEYIVGMLESSEKKKQRSRSPLSGTHIPPTSNQQNPPNQLQIEPTTKTDGASADNNSTALNHPFPRQV